MAMTFSEHRRCCAKMALRRAGQSLLPRLAQCNSQGFAPLAGGASPFSWHDDTREHASVSGGLPAVCRGANPFTGVALKSLSSGSHRRC
jgi:hypothetical protein